jgi:diacylglycerol kinase
MKVRAAVHTGINAGLTKDYAAGAVLIMSITAGIVGGIIFIPKLIALC